jgi:AraC-like DNA-binding protein
LDFRDRIGAVHAEPAGEPRGILHARAGFAAFSLGRYLPSAELAPFVDYLWSVEWDRAGQLPHVQRVLPNPAVHLSFEPDLSRVTGLSRRRAAFEYRLAGAGRVVGVRFRAGGARPWLTGPVSALTDREAPVRELVELDDVALRRAVQDAPDAPAAAALVDAALVPLRPEADPTVDRVAGLVDAVAHDPSIRRAADLARLAGTGVRSLQRLCAEWVGVGPTWLVRCARLQEAAGRAEGGPVDWAVLAAELGYADQSHLVRDFARVVGEPPARYARAAAAGQPATPERSTGTPA